MLAVAFPSFITELHVISSHWPHESIEELFRVTVVMEDAERQWKKEKIKGHIIPEDGMMTFTYVGH